MNKIIENADDILKDMTDGYLWLNQKSLTAVYDENGERIQGAISKKEFSSKVSVVIGGGAGNEPWCLGYVGEGMADALVCGNVYTAPPAYSILELGRNIYNEKGILYIGTNHMGDHLNFELVKELMETDSQNNIDSECVFVNDDIASDVNDRQNRRGIAGIFLAVKMAGAASEAGYSLKECKRLTEKSIERIRTLSVTVAKGYMPANRKPMQELEDGRIEYGMGFNGEPGIKNTALESASAMVGYMMDLLVSDIAVKSGEKLVAVVSGLGGTSRLELMIVMNELRKYIENNALPIHYVEQSDIFCPQCQGGFSISLMAVDEELKKLFDRGAYTPMYYREAL